MKQKIALLFFVCLIGGIILTPYDGICRNTSDANSFLCIDKPLAEKSAKLSLKERIVLRLLRHQISKHQKRIVEWKKQLPPIGCSKIVLKNGDIIEANIIQITPTEIKYKRCGKPNDPEIILSKKEVLSVKAEDGEIIYRNTGSSNVNNSNNSNGEPKLDPLAIASLATGASGLLIGLVLSGFIGILAGIVGIVLGGISIFRIKRNPDKYRGNVHFP